MRAEKSVPAFAVASIVLKLTVTVRSVVPASVTVNVAPAPSRAIASLIESDGGAFLSMIVPSPWPSSTLLAGTADGLERLTLRVSFSSVVESPSTATAIVFVSSPGANVRRPLPVV